MSAKWVICLAVRYLTSFANRIRRILYASSFDFVSLPIERSLTITVYLEAPVIKESIRIYELESYQMRIPLSNFTATDLILSQLCVLIVLLRYRYFQLRGDSLFLM